MKTPSALSILHWYYYQDPTNKGKAFQVWVDELSHSELLMYLENYEDEGPDT